MLNPLDNPNRPDLTDALNCEESHLLNGIAHTLTAILSHMNTLVHIVVEDRKDATSKSHDMVNKFLKTSMNATANAVDHLHKAKKIHAVQHKIVEDKRDELKLPNLNPPSPGTN